ncbi:MAG: beta-N-acetylglucosaminidase domain-containing protein [Thermodesulfobacteriota bacterium]
MSTLPARASLVCCAAALLVACSDRDVAPGAGSPFAVRGVIEGFYGEPYDLAARARIIRFIGERGMNAYVYAPKNDPLHRDEWREPYPANQLAEFRELARVGAESGVRFYFAIAPGITYDADDPADFDRLATKLASIHREGVTGFALLFDDLLDPTSTALDPELQADLTARVADLVAGFGEADLWFIGHVYAGLGPDLAANRGLFAALSPLPPQVYYDAYARAVPPALPIMWTGPGVFSTRLTRADAQGFRDFAHGRRVVVWDNFPANDALTREVFLGPYLGRDPELAEAVDGIVLNLMNQPHASLVSLATAARYMADPASYDAEAAWSDALLDVGGEAADALHLFAEQHRGHPVLAGADEAVELGARLAAAFETPADASAVAELRAYLAALRGNEAELAARLADERLREEIAPWSAKLTLLADAALAGLDALDGAAAREAYEAKRDAARAEPWAVAETVSSAGLAALSGGHVNPPVDRFAELFAAIDARLGSPSASGRVATRVR